MKTIIITSFYILFIGNIVFAQHTKFTTSGIIEFEKTVNVYGLIKQQIGKNPPDYQVKQFEEYKKTEQQFRAFKSTLTFGNNQTLFTPAPPAGNERLLGNDNPMMLQFNQIYTNLAAGTNTVQKSVYDEVFLVQDGIRKIRWKITNDTREIAGYTCRRANGLMMDSIYVVAFYTEMIHVSGGPESFNGLPGMILGIALPHENVTWFATKVTDRQIQASEIAPPKKGKLTNNKQLLDKLKSIMRSWGDAGPYELKVFLL